MDSMALRGENNNNEEDEKGRNAGAIDQKNRKKWRRYRPKSDASKKGEQRWVRIKKEKEGFISRLYL